MRRSRKRLMTTLVVALTLGAGAVTAGSPASAADTQDDCPWLTSTESNADRARQIVARMTLDEKITTVHGIDDSTYAGATTAIPRLCIPQLTLADGPSGVHLPNSYGGDTTQLPSETALAASFDPDVAYDYGSVLGGEARAKGADVTLSPTINIVRDPRWGRAFESMGEDPYETGALGAAHVEGVQDQGTMAQVKHWALYNQETNRGQSSDNVLIDDRTVHEIYAAAFGAVVREADPASVMCSYSWVNGVNACESSYLYGILKDENDFDGFVTSDWWGTKSTADAANAGLDMEMPDDARFGTPLADAVSDGDVPMSRLNDMVERILTQEFRFGLLADPRPRTPEAPASTAENRSIARAVSEAGTVLLKNNDVLPIASSTSSIAVIGDGAGVNTMSVGGGSAWAQGSGTVTPFDGIRNRAADDGIDVAFAQGYAFTDAGQLPAIPTGDLTPSSGTGHGLTAEYFKNTNLSGTPVVTSTSSYLGNNWDGQSPVGGVPGSDWSARWSGTVTAPTTGTYTFSITSDDGSRLFLDGMQVIDNWADQGPTTKTYQVDLNAGQEVPIAVEYYNGGGGSMLQLGWRTPGGSTDPADAAVDLAADSDVAVVYANLYTNEGDDLSDISLPANQNELIEKVAAANPNTIVVLNTGSAVTMPWLSDVSGVLEAWYPGQESGNAIAALLFGDVSPSGKLPVTFPKDVSDLPASGPEQFPGKDGEVDYSEGLEVGYRWYDANDIAPEFPFGFGLTYSTFAFSNLSISDSELTEDGSIEVSADVTNTGTRAASEVAQLYLSYPDSVGEPPRSLKGFAKVDLDPGQSQTVTFPISAEDASYWNAAAHQSVLAPGTYQVHVGSSSSTADLPLSGSFQVLHTTAPRYVSVDTPATVAPGETIDVVTTFHNDGMDPAAHVINSLDLPDGWTAEAVDPRTENVPGGGKLATTWHVTVPESEPGGSAAVSAITVVGGETRSDSASIAVEYASVADAYDTVGVTDDNAQEEGNLDRTGASFSLQALADEGVEPGQEVPHIDDLTFPDVPAGQPDAITMDGQTITVQGTGEALQLLLTAYSGDQNIDLTLRYSDGTSSEKRFQVNDWWSGGAADGTVMVARTEYQNNRVPGKDHEHGVSLYGVSVPLDPAKTLRAITLPSSTQAVLFAVGGVAPRAAATAQPNPESVESGSTVHVHGTGYGADEAVAVTLQPGDVEIGHLTATADGVVDGTVAIPSGTAAGTSTVALEGEESMQQASTSLDVTAVAVSLSSLVLSVSSQVFGDRRVAHRGLVSVDVVGVSFGTVTFSEGSTVVGTAPVIGGVARLVLPRKLAVGEHRFTASMAATASTSAAVSPESAVFTVKKAALKKLKVKATKKVRKKGYRPHHQVKVKVKASKKLTSGTVAKGKVKLRVKQHGSFTTVKKKSMKKFRNHGGKLKLKIAKRYVHGKKVKVKAVYKPKHPDVVKKAKKKLVLHRR